MAKNQKREAPFKYVWNPVTISNNELDKWGYEKKAGYFRGNQAKILPTSTPGAKYLIGNKNSHDYVDIYLKGYGPMADVSTADLHKVKVGRNRKGR